MSDGRERNRGLAAQKCHWSHWKALPSLTGFLLPARNHSRQQRHWSLDSLPITDHSVDPPLASSRPARVSSRVKGMVQPLDLFWTCPTTTAAAVGSYCSASVSQAEQIYRGEGSREEGSITSITPLWHKTGAWNQQVTHFREAGKKSQKETEPSSQWPLHRFGQPRMIKSGSRGPTPGPVILTEHLAITASVALVTSSPRPCLGPLLERKARGSTSTEFCGFCPGQVWSVGSGDEKSSPYPIIQVRGRASFFNPHKGTMYATDCHVYLSSKAQAH